MKKLFLVSLTILIASTLILIGCAAPAPAPAPGTTPAPTTAQPHAKVEVIALVSQPGGTTYIIGNAMGEIMKKYHPWIRFVAQETKGSGDAATWINQMSPEEKTRAWLMAADVAWYDLINGNPPFPKMPDMKIICSMSTSAGTFVANKKEIKTVEDFAGRKLGVGNRGTGPFKQVEVILKARGVYEKADLKTIGFDPSAQAMVDGLVDAGFFVVGSSAGNWIQSSAWSTVRAPGRESYIMSLPNDSQKWAEIGGIKMAWIQVPANVVGNPEPFGAQNVRNAMVVALDAFDKEVAYEIVKTISEHSAELVNFSPTLKNMTPQFIAQMPINTEAQVHPGALKYFKEKGIKVGLD